MLNKKFVLFSFLVILMSHAAYSQTQFICQPPYCNGPGAPSGPTPAEPSQPIYNPGLCGEGDRDPRAYIPNAIDQDGDTSPASQNVDPNLSPADRLKQELAKVGVERFTAPNYKPGLIRHIVLFRYNGAVSSEQKEEVIRRFLALRTLSKRNGRIYILSIETGSEISGEGLDQGLEQGFIVTFKSQGDRNYYVGQPIVTDSRFYDLAHQAFKDFVGPLLDQNGALVFDFSVGKCIRH